jgi:uncharacterized protein
MFDGSVIKVIIPALNEAASIGKVLADVPDWVDETIVVDNGSTDETAGVAATAGAHVVHEPCRGYGQACLTGMAAVDCCDIVVFLDGDYSDFPEQMDRLVRPIVEGKAEMVLGRRIPVHGDEQAFTPPQRFGTALACGLMRLFWGGRYRDMGPFRAIRFPALRRLNMQDTTYGWTVEMQIKALLAGLRVREVNVDYRQRIGVSKISGTVRGVWGAGTKILGTIGKYLLQPPRLTRIHPERLIVFSRWPIPGQTKTRLIPALGPLRAAELQRRMTEGTIRMARTWANPGQRDIEVRHAGGTWRQMRRWLGPGIHYRPQPGGNLGRRMDTAFRAAFAAGAERVVLVGTDCPGLTSALLDEATKALESHDLVLGPSADGGYWLIAMNRPLPVFDGVAWSTESVFEQTLTLARRHDLDVHLLPTRNDVDLPEDLDAARPFFDADRPAISVIIPARNEAGSIQAAIRSAEVRGAEVLVVDGGSTDGTPEQAAEAGATVLHSPPGRAPQQNAGAAATRGDVLLFLHADTILPADWEADVFEALLDPQTVGGGFEWATDGNSPYLRMARFFVHLRTTYGHEPWGDQAIFVRRADFAALGGFPNEPIAEDRDFVRALRRRGRIVSIPKPVVTSARRWRTMNPIRAFLINRLVVLGCMLGLPRQWLRRIY